MNWETFKMELVIFGAVFGAASVEPLAKIIEKIAQMLV
jgi:hypothetical protein